MKIEQSAGNFTLTSYTDGWPINTRIDFHGVDVIHNMSINDMYDLRYALDRQIAQIEQELARIEQRRSM